MLHMNKRNMAKSNIITLPFVH